MKITCRDFLDKPYLQGWEHCKQIFEAASLQQRVMKVALTILLWIPFINVGVHLVLKGLAPTSPLSKLRPHLSPMSAQEKEQCPLNSWGPPGKMGTFDYGSREARFGINFERTALMRVNDRRGSSVVFDLRMVDKDSSRDLMLYCPFEIVQSPNNDRRLINESNSGWLLLSHDYDKDAISINRIDNFNSSEVRLGSALVQFAIEMSLKEGYGGKVTLCSTNHSAGFYYRLGFIFEDAEFQKEIVKEYQNNKSTLDLGGDMYLPPEAITIWQQKTAESPILG